jgi:hypothetical protein
MSVSNINLGDTTSDTTPIAAFSKRAALALSNVDSSRSPDNPDTKDFSHDMSMNETVAELVFQGLNENTPTNSLHAGKNNKCFDLQ